MRAFYHPDQALHDPQQFMRFGKVGAPKDLPVRTERLLEALSRHGVTAEIPAAHGIDPMLAVHTADYVAFLELIWTRWASLPDHGIEVWPNAFPYWNGRPEDSARPPCPSEDIIGQVGWYMGDLAVPMGPNSWRSILRSCETAVAAAEAVQAGESLAYALCRPSGHHARSDRASGFCYVNNNAVAAQHLRRRFGRVAILDVDAHHGDGTQQIFYGRDDILTVSIHADPKHYYPYYTGFQTERGYGAGEGANLNLSLAPGAGWTAFEAALAEASTRIRAFAAEALVVALGYDAHARDPIGVLKLETPDFGRIGAAARALGLPTLVVQEGGYAIDVIGDCLAAFLKGVDPR